jgi:hypothetical protein
MRTSCPFAELVSQLGRPYTMEILETRLDDKINALVDNMDGTTRRAMHAMCACARVQTPAFAAYRRLPFDSMIVVLQVWSF